MPFLETPLDIRLTVAQLGASAHVVTVTGELDLHSAPTLRERLEPLAGESTCVIVDLSGVTFIDSTTLGVLTRAARKLRSHGGELMLAGDDPRLRRLLEMTGMLGLLRVEPSLTEAVARVVGDRAA